MISRNDPCWCGSQKKWKKCHYPLKPKTDNISLQKEYFDKYQIILKNKEQIEKIKKSCHLAAQILDKLCRHAKEGVTTNQLDKLSMELHKKANATPATIGYGNPPYPKSICTSLNDVICHGIPDDRPLEEGDIMNIDVTCILDGYYGDCSRMVMIGEVSEEKKKIVDVSYQCLMEAIAICKPNLKILEIANVVERIAKKNNCSVVHQFVGHGVGVYFHEPPQVPYHYNNLSIPLVPGMIFTIEPMINVGKADGVLDKADGWTARTIDGKPSAQWEHTILITETSCKILTKS